MERDIEPGTCINVGGGECITVNQLFDAMATHLHSSVRPQYASERPGDIRHSQAGLDRARSLLGYAPTVHWREGLARTIEWYAARFSSQRA
jgi:UDP-glucose 4-epimerase